MNDVGASVRGVTHVRRARDPEHRVVRRATPRRATDCVIVVVVVVATAAAVVVVVVVVVVGATSAHITDETITNDNGCAFECERTRRARANGGLGKKVDKIQAQKMSPRGD